MTDLHAQRTRAQSRLAELRQARGAALLDGAEFSDVEIAQAEAQIAALDEAEAEATRRQRAADAKDRAQLRRQLARELQDKSEARLALVGQAERACRDLVSALSDILAVSDAMRSVIKRMGENPPSDLSPLTMPTRLSNLMAPVLAGIRDHRYRFGSLAWHFTGMPDRNWVEAERRAVNLEHLTKD